MKLVHVMFISVATSYPEATAKAQLALKYSDIEEQYQQLENKSSRRNRAGKRLSSESSEENVDGGNTPGKRMKHDVLSNILNVPEASMSGVYNFIIKIPKIYKHCSS